MAEEQIDKIVIPLEEEWHGHSIETLWGKKVGKDIYKIDNIPFFAKGISFDDTVQVIRDEDNRLIYKNIVSSGNFCTYRFIFEDNIKSTERKEYLSLLQTYGDIEFYEKIDLYALSVPKEKVYELYNVLSELEQDGILDFEEGDCKI